MNLLAIDTSTEYCSVALWKEGKFFYKERYAGHTHSELILPLLSLLLKENQLGLSDIQGIAWGAGPGSFTGLRIACGIVQGLAVAKKIPVVGVCTLEAMAQQIAADQIVVCLDARMNEIYHASYQKEGERRQVVTSPNLCKPEQAPLLPGEKWVGCGNGFTLYKEALARIYANQLSATFTATLSNAKAVLEIAVPQFKERKGVSAAEAAPLYIRNKVALTVSELAR